MNSLRRVPRSLQRPEPKTSLERRPRSSAPGRGRAFAHTTSTIRRTMSGSRSLRSAPTSVHRAGRERREKALTSCLGRARGEPRPWSVKIVPFSRTGEGSRPAAASQFPGGKKRCPIFDKSEGMCYKVGQDFEANRRDRRMFSTSPGRAPYERCKIVKQTQNAFSR